MDKKTYKKEVGKVTIEYACGHTFGAPRTYIQVHRAGTKTIRFTVSADDDFSECPMCRLRRLEAEQRDAA